MEGEEVTEGDKPEVTQYSEVTEKKDMQEMRELANGCWEVVEHLRVLGWTLGHIWN